MNYSSLLRMTFRLVLIAVILVSTLRLADRFITGPIQRFQQAQQSLLDWRPGRQTPAPPR